MPDHGRRGTADNVPKRDGREGQAHPLQPTCLRFGSAHLGYALVELARDVRNDADLALDEHELRAVMHLVLLNAEKALEACLGGFAVRLGDLFGEEFVRQGVQPGGELVALGADKGDDLGLGSGLGFLRGDAVEHAKEVDADERGQAIGFMNLLPDARGNGNVG